jgi:hypothetical protein
MTDAAWEVEKANYLEKIKGWINLNISTDSSAAAFAIAEALQIFIQNCDVTEMQRGAMVTDITGALRENNKLQIAIYNAHKKVLQEGKQQTKH